MGTAVAQAAKDAGVQHFVWSSLPDVAAQSGGKWSVPHFTSKAQVGHRPAGQRGRHTCLAVLMHDPFEMAANHIAPADARAP